MSYVSNNRSFHLEYLEEDDYLLEVEVGVEGIQLAKFRELDLPNRATDYSTTCGTSNRVEYHYGCHHVKDI